MEIAETETVPGAAWAQVAAAVAPGLMRLAVMLTGTPHDAQDLLQSTYARAHVHGERIAAMAAPGAYVRKVMLNEHLSRRRTRHLRTVPLEHAAAIVTPEPALVEDDLWPVLARLPRQQRAVLVLRYYEDLPDSEIAELLGCAPATVRSHASHALARMRTLLNTQESR